MTLDDYQLGARRTMNRSLSDDDQLLDAAAGLAEEAGEVLGHVRKHLFQDAPLDRERLSEELGDALWCVAAGASAIGVQLSEVAAKNIEKLHLRYPLGLRRGGP